jgi:hypothetical protein
MLGKHQRKIIHQKKILFNNFYHEISNLYYLFCEISQHLLFIIFLNNYEIDNLQNLAIFFIFVVFFYLS